MSKRKKVLFMTTSGLRVARMNKNAVIPIPLWLSLGWMVVSINIISCSKSNTVEKTNVSSTEDAIFWFQANGCKANLDKFRKMPFEIQTVNQITRACNLVRSRDKSN